MKITDGVLQSLVELGNDGQAGDIHVIPTHDEGMGEPAHQEHSLCFCGPVLHYTDIVTRVSVWVHRDRAERMQ